MLERTGGLELDVFEKTLTEANSGHPISYFVIEDSKERKEYIWLYTSLSPKTRGALHQLFEIYVRCFGFEGTIGYEGYYSDNDMLLEESQRRGESDL